MPKKRAPLTPERKAELRAKAADMVADIERESPGATTEPREVYLARCLADIEAERAAGLLAPDDAEATENLSAIAHIPAPTSQAHACGLAKAEAPKSPASRRGVTDASSPEAIKRAAKAAAERGTVTTAITGHIIEKGTGERDVSITVAEEMMREVMEDVNPRGALERLLAEQLVMVHAQAQMSHWLAAEAKTPEHRDRALNGASRLLADFRRTIGALRSMREPTMPTVHARMANVAAQQVVYTPNELGARDAE